MSNIMTEYRQKQQTQFGNYCNQMRALNLKPKAYHQFQEKMDTLNRLHTSKKGINQALVSWTRDG